MYIYAQYFARFLGLLLMVAGAYVFYYFGVQFMPQYEESFTSGFDVFLLFATFGSFFIGVPALLWVGYRMLSLLTFSKGWLTYVAIPVSAGLVLVYDVKKIAAMDEQMTSFVLFILLLFTLRLLLRVAYAKWYTPLSHDDPRALRSIELKPPSTFKKSLRYVLLTIILIALLVLHPNDIATSTRMLLSPVGELSRWLLSLM